MAEYVFETPLGINVSELRITQFPRIATLTFSHGDRVFRLWFENPYSCRALMDALDDCWQIRIVDLNDDGSQLEFGRYKVEIWDEDNPFAEFTVDGFEQSLLNADRDP